MARIVTVNHLAARYYSKYGWDLETLEKYLVKGCFVHSNSMFPGHDYWLLDVGGAIDVDRLITDFPDLEVKDVGSRGKDGRTMLLERNW